MAGVVARHDDQPGCALVEAVDDSGPRLTSGPRPAPAAPQQRVDEGARVMAGRRMHNHARRLVDDHQVRVFVDDLERDRLGGRNRDVGRWDLVLDDVPFRNAVRGIGGLAVDADHVAFDEPRGSRTAELAFALRDEAVEPGRGDLGDQAALGLRNTYPTISRSTPTLTAESATLKTGQKWKLMKSVTPPPLMMRSNALPSAPPTMSPRTASPLRSPGWRRT